MFNLTRKDYLVAAIAGFFTGVCIIPVLSNSNYHSKGVFILLPLFLAVAWMIGLWLGNFLSSFWKTIFQLAKFAEVGFLNTAINFGLLNLLSLATGVTSGVGAGGINIPGTILSACNSYVWNKFWVFEKIDNKGFFADAPSFAVVTIIGLVINSAVLALFTSMIHPILGLSSQLWLNIGKVVATAVSFLVNFLGYKLYVFKKVK